MEELEYNMLLVRLSDKLTLNNEDKSCDFKAGFKYGIDIAKKTIQEYYKEHK